MKNKIVKTLLASSAAAAILLSGTAGGSAYAASAFKDVEGYPQAAQITALQQAGIFKGGSDGTFNPQGILTNAQAVQLTVDTFGLNIDNLRFIKKPEASDSFPKAKNDAWYSGALIIAAYSGLELPRDLDPNAPATRSSFASMLIRAGQSSGALPMLRLVPVDIKDEASIPDGGSGPMQEALAFGLLKLDKDGNIRPNQSLTRAEAAAVLYQAAVKGHAIEAK
ncbi:S-layer homology domain-containing protein [Saccharibacillus sp. CPCC 101409]|uniref:S-layer homology domain-containing protein n=1 Tax=Saccharibacillus sp. CPCC 101409 TaxID=3058041 RepID=UPI00267165FB|nr:S-layer homology domain-containing protein [Saccharibacillus sp. CPCC 101409]MDO3410249.1 S-layer homology domain-containing protein [Saccharibacillus sp. CPCC 101409]